MSRVLASLITPATVFQLLLLFVFLSKIISTSMKFCITLEGQRSELLQSGNRTPNEALFPQQKNPVKASPNLELRQHKIRKLKFRNPPSRRIQTC